MLCQDNIYIRIYTVYTVVSCNICVCLMNKQTYQIDSKHLKTAFMERRNFDQTEEKRLLTDVDYYAAYVFLVFF